METNHIPYVLIHSLLLLLSFQQILVPVISAPAPGVPIGTAKTAAQLSTGTGTKLRVGSSMWARTLRRRGLAAYARAVDKTMDHVPGVKIAGVGRQTTLPMPSSANSVFGGPERHVGVTLGQRKGTGVFIPSEGYYAVQKKAPKHPAPDGRNAKKASTTALHPEPTQFLNTATSSAHSKGVSNFLAINPADVPRPPARPSEAAHVPPHNRAPGLHNKLKVPGPADQAIGNQAGVYLGMTDENYAIISNTLRDIKRSFKVKITR